MLEVFFRHWIEVGLAVPHRLLKSYLLLLSFKTDFLFLHEVFEKAIRHKVILIDLELNFSASLCHLLRHSVFKSGVWLHNASILLTGFLIWVNKKMKITLSIFNERLFINFISKVAKVFKNEILMMVNCWWFWLILTQNLRLTAALGMSRIQKAVAEILHLPWASLNLETFALWVGETWVSLGHYLLKLLFFLKHG